MNGRWLRSRLRSHFRIARRPELEALEARWLLTSSISGTNVVALVGQDTTLDVANFQADSSLNFASATIDWGDGSTDTSGVINHDPTTAALATKGNITGDHTYSQPGTYTITVTAQESGTVGSGHTATVTSTATVSGAINPGPPLSLTVVQGVAFNALTLATFTTELPRASTSEISASIDWGDNSGTSPGTIVPAAVALTSSGAVSTSGSASSASVVIVGPSPTPTPIPSAAFAVTGAHTYDTAGSFTATITISDTSGDSVTTTADITVASPSLTITAQGQDVSAVVGDGTTPLVVASFTVSPSPADLSTAILTPGDFQATIDWGDGTTPTSGQIFFAVLDPPGGPIVAQGASQTPTLPIGPGYFVEGEHDYTQAGTDTITVTITGPGGASATATSTATVTSPTNPGPAQGIPFDATTNQPDTNQTVAAFPAAGPNDSPGNYTATIDWGDGSTPTTGTVSGVLFTPDSSGGSGGGSPITTTTSQAAGGTFVPLPPILADQFRVSGNHTYTMAGTFTVTVTITNQNGTTQTATSTATISNDTITASPLAVAVQTDQPNASLAVASFNDSAGLPAGDFTVMIDWGDGSTPNGGTVEQGPFAMPLSGSTPTATTPSVIVVGPSPIPTPPIYWDSPYVVFGQHNYSAPGQYTITVTITSTLGAQATVTSSADVTTAPPVPIPTPITDPGPPTIIQPTPVVLPVITPTNPIVIVLGSPVSVAPPPVSTPSPVTVVPAAGDPAPPSSNDTSTQSDPPPGPVDNTIQPQPTVIVGASHPNTGSKKHHASPKVHLAKTGHVKAGHEAAPAPRGKHKRS